MLLWVGLVWPACGWPVPVALPGPGAKPYAIHSPYGEDVRGQTLSCPLVPLGWLWWEATGDQREAAYTVGRGKTEAGEPEMTFRAPARSSAQSRNHRPSCLPLPVAASSCTDAGCKCPPLSCPPPPPKKTQPAVPPHAWLAPLSSKDVSFPPGIWFPQLPAKQWSCPTARRRQGQVVR